MSTRFETYSEEVHVMHFGWLYWDGTWSSMISYMLPTVISRVGSQRVDDAMCGERVGRRRYV